MEKAQLANLIHQLFQASQSEERQILEHQLQALEANQDQHINNVVQLLLDNENPDIGITYSITNFIAQIKISIAVYIRNYVRKILNYPSASLSSQYMQQLLNIFYQILVSPTVEFPIKKHIYLVFESLLMIYQAQESDSTSLHDFYNNLFSSFQGLLSSNNIDIIKGALLICQAALQSIRNPTFLAKVFSGLANLQCKLAEHYISLLSKDLMMISALPQDQLSLENPIIQSILGSLDLIQEWVNIHESIMERWESKKFFGFNLLAHSHHYSQIFTQILALVVQTQTQSMQSFISLTGIQKLDHLLNKIKIKTLECMNFVFKYIFDMMPNQFKNESPFLDKGIKICPSLVNSLVDIAQRPNIEDLIEDETYQDIIVETIETLALFVAEKEFYDILVPVSRNVLVNVCLTLMRTTKPEYEQMLKDPEQFVALALDTCDKQKSKIVKTQAAKLLETICDNIDGAVSFIALFTCQSLSLALDSAKLTLGETFFNTEYLVFKDSIFLNSNPEIIGETCLVALTAISYILPRRADLVPIFEDILAKNIDQILNQGSTLLRVRMSLLLGYYADMLFEKYPEAFNKVMDFLIQSVGLHGEQKVIALQSADTLNTIISDKDLIPRLEPQLPRLITILVDLNRKISIKLYFNFLLDFVKFYHEAIGESIIPFLKSIVDRILVELKNCHEKGEKNNLIINKCWNIIRQIIELESFIPVMYDSIENELKPLFEFMVDPKNIEFEDDIILALKTFIRKTGQVSPTLWTIFPHLTKVFEKSKNTFGNLLDTLNQYLLHGKDQIAMSREYLTILVNMASASLFSLEPNVTIQNSEGAILFQLLFQVYAGTQVLDEYFEQILGLVVKRMTANPMQDHLKRHLICVFLTAMAYSPNYTIAYLEKNQSTQQFFGELFALSDTFTNIYERKIFIIGLSQALNAQTLPTSMIQNLLEIMQQIIAMLNKLKEQEAKALNKAGKKEIKEDQDEEDESDEGDDDDDEDEDEDEEEDDEEEQAKGEPTVAHEEMKDDKEESKHDDDTDSADEEDEDDNLDEVFDLNVTMDLLQAPFKKTDEFAIFNQVLKNLYDKDQTYVNNLVAQLNEKDRKFLKEHIETKRIKIEHKGIETDVARRIIKVKRRGGVGSGASGSVPK